MSEDTKPAIAIIGMSCRFPGADDVAAYWDVLRSGRETLTRFDRETLERAGLSAELIDHPDYVPVGGRISEPTHFDAGFFGFSKREAKIMDPQHRLFLQQAWSALEHAGYAPKTFDGAIGVFAGSAMNTYLIAQLLPAIQNGMELDPIQALVGADKDFLTTRTSYKLNLRGPSLNVQTACSTSLVAIHLACESLLNYESDIALAGGVRVSFPQVEGYRYQNDHILSPDGHCRAFDAAGQGTIFGDGAGLVALKRLDEAQEDGDTIHAVILGTAINNDGFGKIGFTAPSVEGQSEVISMAHLAAGITADSVGYVECHGTGTALGDPIEMKALTRAFRQTTDQHQFCAVGSVKTNMGHLDTAAGVAGLIKTALCLKHKTLVPTLHYQNANPAIDFPESPFYVHTETSAWSSEGPRRAGVSSFGIGGTNAHIILEEPPPVIESREEAGPHLFCVSAKSEEAVEAQTQALEHALDQDWGKIALTLAKGRELMHHRRFTVLSERGETLSWQGEASNTEQRPIVFLFPGQGSQEAGMGAALYRRCEPFREAVDRCAALAQPHLGLDLRDLILNKHPSEADEALLARTDLAQPAIFTLSFALSQQWKSWEIEPAALLGHSVGEWVAAHLAGVVSLEDALRLVCLRGKAMASAEPGAMLALSRDAAEAHTWLPEELDLAVINGPEQCVVSGPHGAIDAFAAQLETEGIRHRRLKTSHGYHSRAMEQALPLFREALNHTQLCAPQMPIISNLTGTPLTDEAAVDPEYWCRQLRETVRFSACLEHVLQTPDHLYLEVGPGRTLTGILARLAKDADRVVSLPRRAETEAAALLTALGGLWATGAVPDPSVYLQETHGRVPLPTYPFQTQDYSIKPGVPAMTPEIKTETAPEPPFNAADHIRDALTAILAKMLDEPSEQISPDLPFVEMGADSLILVELVQRVENHYGVRISVRQFFEEVDTLNLLVDTIEAEMPEEKLAALRPVVAPVSAEHVGEPAVGQAVIGESVTGAPADGEPVAVQTAATPPVVQIPATPAPAPVPMAQVPISAPLSDVQSVIQQQLQTMQQIMAQQLAALGAAPVTTPGPAAPPVTHVTPATPATTAMPTTPAPATPSVTPATAVPEVEADTRVAKKSRYASLSVTEKRYRGLTDTQREHLETLIEAYTTRTARSKDMTQRFRPVLSDNRASAGFRFSTKEMLYPILGERSLGDRLWDIDGNEYIDIAMGFGVDFFGHSPDFLSEALETQLAEGNQLGPQCRLAGEVAELLHRATGKDRFTFCNTGTESVMIAIRLARAHTGRQKIVLFNGSFHGQYDGTLATAKPGSDDPHAIPIVPGITDNTIADILVVDYGSPRSLEQVRAHAHEIAAVVVEPIQSDRPEVQPKEFLHRLRELTRETGILLIFDEMITGFRLHQRGAQGYFDVEADICTYGKVVGGGLPIGIVAGPADVMDRIDGGMWTYGDTSYPRVATTFFAGTFSKLPMTMAVCRAVLLELEKKGPTLQEQLNARTARFCDELNQFFAQHRIPLKMVAAGSLFRFAFQTNLDLMFYHLLMRGVYIWEGRNCFFSTAHSDADIHYVAAAIKDSLAALQQAGYLTNTAPIQTTALEPMPAADFSGYRATAPARITTSIPDQSAVAAKPRVYPKPETRAALDFSLSFFGKYEADYRPDKYDLLMNSARYADLAGFHAIWVPERHFHPFGGFSPNPSVICAALARETEHIQLRAGSVVLPLHHPVRIAEEWSAVDNLSGGRVGIAFASGWHPDDFVFAPDVFGRHRDQTFTGLQQIQRLWRGDRLQVTNGKGNPVEACLYPMPRQAELPVALTIVSNADTYAEAGRLGAGVLTNLMGQTIENLAENIRIYRKALAEAGHPEHIGRVTVLMHTFLDEDRETAIETARQPFYDYLSSSLGLFKTLARNMGFQYDFDKLSDEDRDFLLGKAYDRYVATSALIGTLESTQPIAQHLVEIGVDEIACFVDFGVEAHKVEAAYPLLNQLRKRFENPTTPPDGGEEHKPQALETAPAIPRATTAPPHTTTPLSEGQRQLWLLSQLSDQGSIAYQIRIHLKLDGPFDIDAMRTALQAVVDRHEALRITLDEHGEHQYVRPQVRVDLPLHEGHELDALIRRDNQTPFDLVNGPLIRAAVVREAADGHHLLITVHTIICDGWSTGVLLGDLGLAYLAARDHRQPDWPEMMGYSAFLKAGRAHLQSEAVQEAGRYWRDQLSGDIPMLNLPTDQAPPAVSTYAGRRLTRRLSRETVNAVKSYSRKARVTPFMTYFSAYILLLHRITDQNDVIVGIPVGGRPFAGSDHLIGYCTHLLPIRHRLEGLPDGETLVQNVRALMTSAYANQDYPFANLIEDMKQIHGANMPPMVTNVFNLERTTTRQDLGALRSQIQDQPIERVAFDINLNLTETEQDLIVDLDVSSERLNEHSSEQFLESYLHLLETLIAGGEGTVRDWPLLDDAAMARQAVFHQKEPFALPQLPVLTRCFADQVAKTPHALAASFEDLKVDYQTLDRRANALANQLRRQGVGFESLVPILADRNLDFLTAILGVFKAGAAYLPLDPAHPPKRLAQILSQTDCTTALVAPRYAAGFAEAVALSERAIDAQILDDWRSEDMSGPDVEETPDQLAYVIFTSGSTGLPKGAMVHQHGMVNHLYAKLHDLDMSTGDRLIQNASQCFDISVWQFLAPLLVGGSVRIVSNAVAREPEALWREVHEHDITILEVVPSYMKVFLDDARHNHRDAGTLNCLMATGEALPPDLCAAWLETFPEIPVVNAYGPTECSDDVTHYTARTQPETHIANMPIGSPVINTRLYVVDRRCRPLPMGIPGELLVGGTGVGRGYLGQPARTAPSFIPDFLGAKPGDRLYRTGDLARLLPGGELEFLGRLDHQIKIRGFRIELGEIEAVLTRHESVAQTLVVDHTDPSGHKRLVAYLTLQDTSVTTTTLIDWVAQNLPEYMVPQTMIQLDQFPLTANGKIDRKALPEPAIKHHHRPPTNETEQRLCAIWEKVLGLKQVGIGDNFFALGGDSILAIQLVSEAQRQGLHFRANQLFTNQTVAQLALYVRDVAKIQIDQGPVQGAAALSPVQKGFFAERRIQPNHFNLAVLLTPRRPIAEPDLRRALDELCNHHDALRLRFDETAQHAEPDAEGLFGLSVSHDLDEAVAFGHQNLDIAHGPLLQAGLVNLADGSQRLHLVVHHLVMDGISWRILLEDLETLLAQAEAAKKLTLPPKTTAWRDWVARLETYAQSQACENERTYWQAQREKKVRDWNLPPRPAEAGGTRTLRRDFDQSTTDALLREAPAAYRAQINDLLLTALGQTLADQEVVRVDLEHHGRVELFDDVDISRTLGWFTSVYPVILENNDDDARAIIQTKEQLRAIPRDGIGYGLLTDETERAAISFNYLGQVDGALTGRFQLADESAGAEQDERDFAEHPLQIDALIRDGRLCIHWIYEPHAFDETQIQDFADAFNANLSRLVQHCLSEESGGVTRSDFPLAELTQETLEPLVAELGTPDTLYQLNPMQRGLLFHTEATPDARVYIEQVSALLTGPIDQERFWRVWRNLADRHESLRSRYLLDDLHALQWVMPAADVPAVTLDWRDVPVEAREERLHAFREQDLDQRFQPAVEPPYRLTLIQLDAQTHYFCFTFHHVMLDGWSLQILFAEFSAAYLGDETLPPVSPTAGYVRWLREQDPAVTRAFWTDLLGDFDAPNQIVPRRPARPELPEQAWFDLEYDAGLSRDLADFAKLQGITLNTLFQAAWATLVSRYSGRDDVVFGVTVSGRPPVVVGVDQMVGLFINTLPVRVKISADQPLGDWLREIQKHHAAAREFEYASLGDVQRTSAVPQGQDLFESLLVFENYPISASLSAGWSGLQIAEAFVYEQVNYPICLLITPGERTFTKIRYSPRQIDPAFVARMSGHLRDLLVGLLEQGDRPSTGLSLLSAVERHELLHEWHPTPLEPTPKPMHRVVSEQARLTPDHPAVISGDQIYSYAELEARSNRLAHWLIAQGIGPEIRVGLFLTRGIHMVSAILGVLKAGGAYVPMDPDHPADRLSYVLEDSRVPLVLTLEELKPALPACDATLVALDRDADRLTFPDTAPERSVPMDAAAYQIYTSGTTGRPKPVANAHAGITNRLNWMLGAFPLQAEDRIIQKTPYTFDISIWEFFWPLMSGATLVMAKPEGHKSPEYLQDLIAARQVTMIHFVPSMLDAFLAFARPERLSSLKRIFCSGEALSGNLVTRTVDLLGVEIHNLYGPTEAAIEVTHQHCLPEAGEKDPPIGKPLPGSQLLVLDNHGHLCSTDIAGELTIGGVQVARGYPGRPALTATRFVPNPWSLTPGGRLYRTGDLARWRAEGVIEYLGRLDHQVKIRGYRIELGEIEAALRLLPGIRDAVVAARDEGRKRMVGYVIADGTPEPETLRQGLLETLPDYMVPTAWVTLEAFPVSANGKLDRKALPAPEQPRQDHDFHAPQGGREEALADVWQTVLGLEAVDRHANLFQLGGDSISSLQVVARAGRQGLRLALTDLFNHPTLAELASVIDAGTLIEEEPPSTGTAALTPIQRWFFDTRKQEPQHFNQAVLLRLDRKLLLADLEQALDKVCDHHDVFRLRFTDEARYVDHPSAQVAYRDLSMFADFETVLQREADAQQAALDLVDGPLTRICLFDCPDGHQRLLWVIHHLIVDGVSWRFLLEDLETALLQPETALPPKTSSWQAWAERLTAAQDRFVDQLPAWKQVAETPALALPNDRYDGEALGATEATVTRQASSELTRRLLSEIQPIFQTRVDDCLLAALGISLLEPGQRLRLDLEGHGREAIFPDLDISRTMGWFTAIVPFVLEHDGDGPALLQAIKRQRQELPDGGLGWGLLNPEHEPAQLVFNYLGRFDQTLAQSELFDLAKESSGRPVSPRDRLDHELNIECLVAGEQLEIHINYSQARHEAATIEALANRFMDALETLTAQISTHVDGGRTPGDFPLVNLDQTTLDRHLATALAIGRAHGAPGARIGDVVEALYPMTATQSGMLFHQHYDAESVDYLEQLSAIFEGDLDMDRFHTAWETLIQRHAILRTIFLLEDRLQLVLQQPTHFWQNQDWRDLSEQRQEEMWARLSDSERFMAMDRTPLRFQVIRVTKARTRFLWTFHHALLDGWSLQILFRELAAIYAKADVALPAARNYRGYVQWLQNRSETETRAFWAEHLAGFERANTIETRLIEDTRDNACLDWTLDPALSDRLRTFAKTRNLTLNTLFQAAWALAIAQLSDSEDVVFGVTGSGRPPELSGVEDMVGLMINTLPLRIDCTSDQMRNTWLAEIQNRSSQQLTHQSSEISHIQAACDWPRGKALFETVLVFENYPIDPELGAQWPGVVIEDVTLEEKANYPLALVVIPEETILCRLDMEPKRIPAELAERLMAWLPNALNWLCDEHDESLSEVPSLGGGEALPGAFMPLPSHDLIADFSRHAQQSPDQPALFCEGEIWSAARLEKTANRVAHDLIARGVRPEIAVGVCSERNPNWIVALLAVMKAGGVYVPLDPKYPANRLAGMMEDSGIELVLCSERHQALGDDMSGTWLPISTLGQDQPDHTPTRDPDLRYIAYTIYTSGSTGRPKGVLVSYTGLANLVRFQVDLLGIQPQDRILQYTSPSFDASISEIFLGLIGGATLHLASPDDVLPGAALSRYLNLHAITSITLTPTVLATLRVGEVPSLRSLIVAGEAASPGMLAEWSGHATIFNGYGPTENTIGGAMHRCSMDEQRPPIGLPIANQEVMILNAAMETAPDGMRGELYLAGPGLARGYSGRPALTAERFLPHPYAREAGARVYRTGDLCALRPGGTLDFFGRVDHQVKIRGIRVETGEILAALRNYEGVADAYVLLEEVGSNNRLIAYVIWTDEGDAEELRNHMATVLPSFMVPAAIVPLKSWPMTPNGKLDRKALPAPEFRGSRNQSPRTEAEEILAGVWKNVLGLDEIGIHDNFFRLGGDSILSIQVVAQANREGFGLFPKQIFEAPTIAQLAVLCQNHRFDAAEQGAITGPVSLSPIQNWFFQADRVAPHHFNQSLWLEVTATTGELTTALQALIAHHDTLRLTFSFEEGCWQARLRDTEEGEHFSLETIHGTDGDLEGIAADAQTRLRLDGPLVHLTHLPDQNLLMIVVHHLCVDAVSWQILLEDLAQLLTQPGKALPPKTTSWRTWTRQLPTLEVRKLPDAALYRLPVDLENGPNDNASEATHTLALETGLTRDLMGKALNTYRTKADEFLLAALCTALAKEGHAFDLLVDLERHGRDLGDVDLSRTVGWFTNLIPVHLSLPQDHDAATTLIAVKEQMRASESQTMGASLRGVEVSFNYLGSLDRLSSEDAPFTMAELPTGPEHAPADQRAHLLEINAFVSGETLTIQINYSHNRHRPTTITALAERLESAIRDLVAHCLEPDAGTRTPSDFPLAKLAQTKLDAILERVGRVEDLYAMTPVQRGMLFHSEMTPDEPVYVEQLAVKLTGSLNKTAMRAAWRWVCQRHAVLRTLFSTEEGVQIVVEKASIDWRELDWHDRETPDYAAFEAQDLRERFHPAEQAPWRCTLIESAPERFHFVLTFHHVILDGWSLPILLQDVSLAYRAFAAGREPEAATPIPFRQYIAWLNRQDHAGAEAIWRAFLAGFAEPNQIAGSETPGKSAYGEANLALSEVLSERLRELCRREELTLNTLFQAAWGFVVGRYSNTGDVVFGVTDAGRPPQLQGVSDMIGMFLNTLPVRVRLDAKVPIRHWLQALQSEQANVREVAYTSLTVIQAYSEVPAGRDLFETLLVFENYPVDDALESGWSDLDTDQASLKERVNYPICLEVAPGKAIELKLRLETTRVSQLRGQTLLAHLERVLTAIADQIDGALQNLPGILPTHLESLERWNQTEHAVPDRCFHHCFEEIVRQNPDKIAVGDHRETLTYAELDARANALAWTLIERGVGPEKLVAILSDRDAAFLIGMLAVFKAGAAYVPLDPQWPHGRMAQITADSGARHVLLSPDYDDRREQLTGVEIVPLISEAVSGGMKAPNVAMRTDHLAYVIYTSGSTGKPKGAMLEHGGMLNHLYAKLHDLEMMAGDVVVQSASQCFDISIWQFLSALLLGGKTLVVDNERAKDPAILVDLLSEGEITVFETVPSMLRAMVQEIGQRDQVPNLAPLRWMVATGEALPPELCTQWLALYPDIPLMNAYGPTECSDDVTHAVIDRPLAETVVHTPIGQAIINTELHVLDHCGEPLPIGVAGELCVGGAGVGRGYLADPKRTALAFQPDPFAAQAGARLYRTGDLTRFEDDGAITYLGRLDHQVKIRGFRIELGEVEAALVGHEQISEAIVVVGERADQKELWGYYVAGQTLEDEAIREHLRAYLPVYMIPRLIALESFPLTPNGKIDRKSLPEPHREHREIREARDDHEKAVLAVWQKVFDSNEIGMDDGFFELGGHSLLAVRLMHTTNEAFGLKLPLASIFEAPQLTQFAALVASAKWRRTLYQSPTPLVSLQPEGTRPPFYCVHPMGGVVHVYLSLAKSLGKDQPFFGLQQQGIDGESEPLTDVVAMAESYVAAIKAQQPEGPYYLSGWSLGGVIAYEMARQFEAAGDEVGMLAVLDTLIHKPGEAEDQGFFDYSFWLEFYAAQLDLIFGAKLKIKARKLRKLTQDDQVDFLVNSAIEKGVFSTCEYGREQVRSFMRVTHYGLAAVSAYDACGYRGDIQLIRARENMKAVEHLRESSRCYNWNHYTSGQVQVHLVPGDHRTMIQEPNVAELAQLLRACNEQKSGQR